MTYGSVCSGIEAASVAWHPLGWRCAFVSEIDKHASAVLHHRFPDTPNLGDFTAWPFNRTQRRNLPGLYERATTIDLLVGGTPCQAFSLAGLRGGMADPRGGLTLAFLRMARRLRPEWVVWENVPGVLSADGGRAFGAFLGGLAELGYGFAYRVLDAQYAGVPQRRRRVFVVGHLGDWRRAAAVLLERESLSGHPPPSREAGQSVAGTLAPGAHGGGYNGQDAHTGHLIAAPLTTRPYMDQAAQESGLVVTDGDTAPTIPTGLGRGLGHNRDSFITAFQCHGSNVGPMGTLRAGNGNETGGVPFIAFQAYQSASAKAPSYDDVSPTLDVAKAGGAAVAFMERGRPDGRTVEWQEEVAYAQDCKSGGGAGSSRWMAKGMAARRFLPVECERLQGFPDDWTATGNYGDGPAEVSDTQRYKMCGNSMAVPVMHWLGKRIDMIHSLTNP